MRSRISLEVIAGVALVTALTIGCMAAIILRTQSAGSVFELTRSADQLSETIKSGTHWDMLENRRDNLRRQIETIGRQSGILKVRVFSKDGRIRLSSDGAEIGRVLDKRAEACYACHAEGRPIEKPAVSERVRIFRTADGTRALGIVNPIQNERSCWAASCHAHEPGSAVLGVLDVTVSLAQADREMRRSQMWLLGLAAGAIAAISLLLWAFNRRLVLRPVEALLAATRRVAEGDLTTKIPVRAKHELAELETSFNAMTDRLAESQRQLAQADKLASVGRLAAGIAHEINNPLTGVLTYASLLLRRPEAPADMRQDLEVVVRETKRCREIVKGLLDFARPSPPHRAPSDLNEVLRRAVSVVVKQLALNRVRLEMDLASDLPKVSADENQIQQVLVNLLLNAADATGDAGGVIRAASRAASLPAYGHAVIRKAHCPAGCVLIDPDVRIGGLPAIRVLRTVEGRETTVRLDPVYGSFRHEVSEHGLDGVTVEYSCPLCRRSLEPEEARCERCGARAFEVEAGGEGPVRWCCRNGCHWSLWSEREAGGPDPVLELSVEDSGQGIAPEDLPRLFEPFFSTKGSRGTGLGLAVTRTIVEGHGGTIEVRTEPGKGTRFTVRLPLEGGRRGEPPSQMARIETPGADAVLQDTAHER